MTTVAGQHLRADTARGRHHAGTPEGKTRVAGVDVARGVALFGMMATHVLAEFNDAGPTTATVVAGGRSAGTFALLAGVSIAFMSGGRQVVHGRARTAVSAGLAVRALLIGLLGLLLAIADANIDVILTFYAVAFLLVIPLLGLRPRVLALITAVLLVLGPLFLVAIAHAGVAYSDDNPTFTELVTDPLGLLLRLLITGEYPVLLYLGLVCAGLAIGRLDLASRRVAEWLLGGGIALAITSRLLSLILLYPLGGLDRLVGAGGFEAEDASPAMTLLWAPEQGSSWWYLALSGPHAHTSLDMVHVLGSAMGVVGACLLLTRISVVRRLVWPLQAAGAMTLTLYSAHILFLETGVLEDSPAALFLFLVVASLTFAVLWRHWQDQGPLERVVAAAATRTRRAVLARTGEPAGRGTGRSRSSGH
jgi:uncharacterized membrane protein